MFSQDSSDEVELYAGGPCGNFGISELTFNITFLTCTCLNGLQPYLSSIECKCECDQELQPYQIINIEQAETIKLEAMALTSASRNQLTSVSTAPRREIGSMPSIESTFFEENVEEDSVLCLPLQDVESALTLTYSY